MALVTGASRGIGKGVALALAREGAQVTVLARTQEALNEVVREIEDAGGTCTAVACDLTEASALDAALERVGVIDVLVNSAGINIPEPFVEVTPTHFEAIFALNVRAPFFAAQRVAQGMILRGSGGVIINVSSQMGHVGAARRSVYCASKHALEGLTKALGVELAPHGIRVVSVAPTFVDTALTAPMWHDAGFRADVLSNIPLGQLASVEDVAQAVVFLASDTARMITGSSLHVDGGWTAR